VLGELIARLDHSDVANSIMATLPPDVARQIERRAMAASLSVTDFVLGAVREFLDGADDDLWFQLLTIVRKSHDPGLSAIQTILAWVVTERQSGRDE
jgi:hypothetical protein